jgi:hypothetical protein
MESMLLGNPFAIKDLVQFAMQGEKKLAAKRSMPIMLLLPFWVDLRWRSYS